MDRELRNEILQRVKVQPNLISRLSRKYHFDLEFYKLALAFNIDVYMFMPDEYKNDKDVIDIIIRNASTSNLNFPYGSLKFHNTDQKLALIKIRSIICYINLYKIIYDEERIFENELFLNSFSDNNALIRDINEPLNCLTDEEKNYIKYRYGLIDGKWKSLKTVSEDLKSFGYGFSKVYYLESESLNKLKKYIKKNGYRLGNNRIYR